MIPNSETLDQHFSLNPFDTWDLDKAKRQWLGAVIESGNLLRQMKNCLWLTCTRLLYRLKESVQLDKETGFAADAITSREAVDKKTHDGGREGWFKSMKPVFDGFLNTSPNSLEKADAMLEKWGIIKKHHNGKGLVAHNEINVRNLVLLLEVLHPQWGVIPECFTWLKSACDKVLGRPFNRFDWERGDHIEHEEIEEAIEQYNEIHPLRAIAIETLGWLQQKSFYRFCVRKTKEYAEKFGFGFGVDDKWLELGDPCDEVQILQK